VYKQYRLISLKMAVGCRAKITRPKKGGFFVERHRSVPFTKGGLMVDILLMASILAFAIMALRAPKLLQSALWLSGASVLTGLLMYLLGAPEIGVIELSVGGGLVTILFVFAINITGEEHIPTQRLLPRPVAIGLVLVSMILLGWMSLAAYEVYLPPIGSMGVTAVLWEDRQLDVMLQIVLIFAGVLGVLSLLADSKKTGEETQ
jgi:uncharacterized MnhB-related membrane protein